MSNPFQEQLLKAGIVSKQQVQQANKDKYKKKKQAKGKQPAGETKSAAQQAAEEKARRDRELNKRKQEQARQKAVSAEIDQLIRDNCIARDEACDIAYNFEHNQKVKQIYINADMKQQIIRGKLGIARIQGRYELVPLSVAEKISQRNDKRVILFSDQPASSDEDDAYADYKIPDDLMW